MTDPDSIGSYYGNGGAFDPSEIGERATFASYVDGHWLTRPDGYQVSGIVIARLLRATPTPASEAAVLEDVLTTLKHARVFITSRQRMYLEGVKLYDQTTEALAGIIRALIASGAGEG